MKKHKKTCDSLHRQIVWDDGDRSSLCLDCGKSEALPDFPRYFVRNNEEQKEDVYIRMDGYRVVKWMTVRGEQDPPGTFSLPLLLLKVAMGEATEVTAQQAADLLYQRSIRSLKAGEEYSQSRLAEKHGLTKKSVKKKEKTT